MLPHIKSWRMTLRTTTRRDGLRDSLGGFLLSLAVERPQRFKDRAGRVCGPRLGVRVLGLRGQTHLE